MGNYLGKKTALKKTLNAIWTKMRCQQKPPPENAQSWATGLGSRERSIPRRHQQEKKPALVRTARPAASAASSSRGGSKDKQSAGTVDLTRDSDYVENLGRQARIATRDTPKIPMGRPLTEFSTAQLPSSKKRPRERSLTEEARQPSRQDKSRVLKQNSLNSISKKEEAPS